MRIIDEKSERKEIWKKIDLLCEFYTRKARKKPPFFDFKAENKKYIINTPWGKEEQRLINDIFVEMSTANIYALDYCHDCFEFNPRNEDYYEKWWHDEDRDVNVYFPSYYPDGDYHFFVAKDFSYGIFGVPFTNELYVINKNFIKLFDQKKAELGLIEME